MEPSKKPLNNLINDYIEHKKIMTDMEDRCIDAEELFQNPEYGYRKGCCETAEAWMETVGVSPKCNYIKERL